MIFEHSEIIKKQGKLYLRNELSAKCHNALDNDIIKEFWYSHTYNLSQIKLNLADDLSFVIGDAEKLKLDGKAYSINVTQSGIAIVGKDKRSLIDGFMTLLDLIEITDDGENATIDCFELKESPIIERRMIHFCIFHSTSLFEFERFVRLCGALKYTHIILEFWGMYKYDCLKELSWKEAYSKEQIGPIIKMANDLGIEVVPMLNHWGHAAASREMYGKHVVLNQNLKLQYLFSPDGWCWNYKNPKVIELLSEMRKELIELCGKGEYFHIGCDEARGFDFSDDSINSICGFINSTAEDLKIDGKRTMVWGDMFITKEGYDKSKKYITNCPNKEREQFIHKALNKEIIMADWQYDVKSTPVETALTLKNAGFDTILCPFDYVGAITACCDTIADYSLYGLIHTTWHTLDTGMPCVSIAATRCWDKNSETPCGNDNIRQKTAAVLRKVYFADSYLKSGWKNGEEV